MRTRWFLPLTLVVGCSFIDDFDKFRARSEQPDEDAGEEAGRPDAGEPDEDAGDEDAARGDAGDNGREDAGDGGEPEPIDAGGDARPPDRDAGREAGGGEDTGVDAFVPDACGPSAAEVCDGRDNDCDGTVDDGFELIACYPDRDDDGFADVSVPPMRACACPEGLIEVVDLDPTKNDCFDDPERDGEDVHPGQSEFFEDGYGRGGDESFDYNCDGAETPQHMQLQAGGCGGVLMLLLCDDVRGYVGAPPDCGDSGEFTSCTTGTLTCGTITETRRQSCR